MQEPQELSIGGELIRPGEWREIRLAVSESYTGDTVHIPVRVMRAPEPGPVLMVTAAVHGNEINGCGVIRELVVDQPPPIHRGTLTASNLFRKQVPGLRQRHTETQGSVEVIGKGETAIGRLEVTPDPTSFPPFRRVSPSGRSMP